MEKTKTIDVRGLEHAQREIQIFPSIENLKQGEKLRLVMEFNPLPLVYMLKAREEFEVAYEKEGPEEWILVIKRISIKVAKEDKKEDFKKLLKELKEGKLSEETKEKAKKLLQTIDAKSLGVIEQELIRDGISHDEIRGSLCDIHLEILKDSLVSKRIEVEPPHPVHTLMEEHKIIIQQLNELDTLIKKLDNVQGFEDMGPDLEKLKDIAHHLVEAESHHQREEDALFPKLKQHDIIEPPDIMKMDHEELRKRKKELDEFAHNPKRYGFDEFKAKVRELGEYLVKNLESHIFKEDNILYQIALQVLSDDEWKEVKKEFDKIGYCFFTPGEQK